MTTETTLQTRLQMIELKNQGLTAAEVARRLGLSVSCVKKFWRRFRREGEAGLHRRSRRPHEAHPRQMNAVVRTAILKIKRAHPHWGAQFIQGELRRRRFRPLPHRRTIERFLKRHSEFPLRCYRRRMLPVDSRRATRRHELWQMDFKTNHRFRNSQQRASFVEIRDMASTLSITIEPLPQGRSGLTSREAADVCRRAFSRVKRLPEAIRTDHGSCFVAPEYDSFPTEFTLYLWGLGVEHELIPVRRPARNGGIERDMRTLTEQFLDDYRYRGRSRLERDAEEFAAFRNRYVPSRSVRCGGRTAAETAARLPMAGRPYAPARERTLFDVGRIYDQLAARRWRRTVTPSGYVSLGHSRYYLGRAWRRQPVELRFDRATCEVVAVSGDAELKRWPIRGLSYEDIVHGGNRSKRRKKRRGPGKRASKLCA
jgi:transposase